jgi:hypothetical protein
MENELILKVSGATILLLLTIISYFGKKTLDKSEMTYDLINELKSLHQIDTIKHNNDIQNINVKLNAIDSKVHKLDDCFNTHLCEHHGKV